MENSVYDYLSMKLKSIFEKYDNYKGIYEIRIRVGQPLVIRTDQGECGICEDGKVEEAKKRLVQVFDSLDMHTSDVDPVKTIKDVDEIVTELEKIKLWKGFVYFVK